MTRVTCVNTGTKYADHDYTGKLFRSLWRNSTLGHAFTCITKSEWPGWWGKMDAFPCSERVVLLDVDLVITGNVDFLFEYDGPLCIRKNPWPGAWCDTSIMSVSPKVGRWIADAFFAAPHAIIKKFRSDQEFIASLFPESSTHVWPAGKTKSYKADNLEAGPDGASIVTFHGEPKPHELPANHWIKEFWR